MLLRAGIFSLCANVENILISGYAQKRDKDGEKHDEFLYSIVFTREGFIDKDFSSIEPINFCMQFPNRCKLSSAFIFKAIKPYTKEESISKIQKKDCSEI